MEQIVRNFKMSSFYVYLPSNVQDISGNNTIGNYVTQLPQQLKLYDDWECALSEIFITKTWHNISEEEIIKIYIENEGEYEEYRSLKPGSYNGINSLLETLNRYLKQISMVYGVKIKSPDVVFPQIELNKETKKITIYPGKIDNLKKIYPSLSPRIYSLLGFPTLENKDPDGFLVKIQDNESIKEGIEGLYEYDLTETIHSFYVCTDIVKSSIVGDSFSQFLRIVRIPKGNLKEVVEIVYDHPIYFPLDKKEFQSIEIDIQDETGETVKFNGGFVIIGLHFRPKNDRH